MAGHRRGVRAPEHVLVGQQLTANQPLARTGMEISLMNSGTNPDADSRAGIDAIVMAVLAERYDIRVDDLAPVALGQNTVNRRARSGPRNLFVKTYGPGGPNGSVDLDGERAAIDLSRLAGEHGVPVAPVLPNQAGQLIDTSTSVPLSVWEWMPGHVVPSPAPYQCAQAGQMLARIHAAFAPLPASVRADPIAATRPWRSVDLAKPLATIDQLQAIITERFRTGQATDFDHQATDELAERRDMLTRLPAVTGRLPERLTAQVLHGDYSPVNILIDDSRPGGQISAVLDFTPPRPELIAYELGRIAVYPTIVTGSDDWPGAARALINAYRQANRVVPDADIRACVRIALIQLVRSLYGVKQHYLTPGLYQDDLDEFWHARHATARALWNHLDALDDMLDDILTDKGNP